MLRTKRILKPGYVVYHEGKEYVAGTLGYLDVTDPENPHSIAFEDYVELVVKHNHDNYEILPAAKMVLVQPAIYKWVE